MAFPQSPLPVAVELQLSGVWTDVPQDVYTRDPITITRGQQDQGSRVDHGKCSLTLNNRSGTYSPRNPLSPLYGQLGRNTKIRVSVMNGTPYLDLDGGMANYAATPDVLALDITGDIDLRCEAEIDWYHPAEYQFLVSKWGVSGVQRSYGLGVYHSQAWLSWTVDGSTELATWADLPLDLPPHAAIRATLDVNNGTGGWTSAFYWAPSMAGPWTYIGGYTLAGTTSIYAGTAQLAVGGSDFGSVPNRTPPIGRVHRAEVRSGIGGTAVANPDFTVQTPGAVFFGDSAGLSWALYGTAAITNRQERFTGEISEWPPRWDVSGQDAWVPVRASGPMRRLGQGKSPLQSAMRREFASPSRTSIVAYWPCEDGKDATELAATAAGAPPLRITIPGVKPAAATPWPSSDALPTMGTGTLVGTIPTYTVTGQTALRMMVQLPSGGLSSTQLLVSIATTGTAPTWAVYANATGQLDLRTYDNRGTQLFATGFGSYYPLGTRLSLGLELTQAGADVTWTLVLYDTDALTLAGGTGLSLGGTLAGRTVGRAVRVTLGADAGLGDTVVGHVALADAISAYGSTLGALIGWSGETARARAARIAAEQALPLTVRGTGGDLVGPQRVATLLDLLDQAAEVGGTLMEQRRAVGLHLRARDSLYNEAPALTLDYTAPGEVPPPLEPNDDDQGVVNDVEVSRDDGTSSRKVLETGRLSILDPPDGIGRYDTSESLNLHTDEQTLDHAGWRLHLATWDEARYPTVHVNLAAAPHLIDQAVGVDTGDRITITNPPVWTGPGPLDLLVLGYSETLGVYDWDITFTCVPYGPYRVAVADDVVLGRADTEGSALAAGATAVATGISVSTSSGPTWSVDHSAAPWDIAVGGEVMTVAVLGTLLNGNPFLDVDAAGWSANSGSTISRVTDVVHSAYGAVASIRVVPDGVSVSGGVRADLSGVGTVTPAASYTAMGWVYSPGGWSDLQACVDWYDSAGAFLSTGLGVGSAVAAGTWTFLSQDLVAPVSASQGRVRMRHGSTPAASDVWYAWAVRMVPTASVTSTSPQAMTVIRSVNGIVKAQVVGEDVRLAHPAIVAL